MGTLSTRPGEAARDGDMGSGGPASPCGEDTSAKRKPAESLSRLGAGADKRARKALAVQAKAKVAAANKRDFSAVTSEQAIRGGRTVRTQVCGALQRGSLLLGWAAALVEENMRAMYEQGWGWDGDAKVAELSSRNARYIVAYLPCVEAGPSSPMAGSGESAGGRTQAPTSPATLPRSRGELRAKLEQWWRGQSVAGWTGTLSAAALADCLQQDGADLGAGEGAGARPVGLIHFRFCTDARRPVLYIYEIQVAREAQGLGVGKALLQHSQDIARSAGMHRVLLTVFKHNVEAQGFYEKHGYGLDSTCPSHQDASCCFRVLGKDVTGR